MTVTLHLKAEIQASLQAQAHASGMRLDDYLLSVVEAPALPAKDKAHLDGLDRAQAVRNMLAFGDKYD